MEAIDYQRLTQLLPAQALGIQRLAHQNEKRFDFTGKLA